MLAPDLQSDPHAIGDMEAKGICVLETLLASWLFGLPDTVGLDAWGSGCPWVRGQAMTQHKHLKARIRARMKKTGEAYSTARRQVKKNVPATTSDSLACHRTGQIAATTALGILLAHHGIHNPVTKKPFSEAMLFGLAGGIGIGTFQFVYEKADFASFFIAGRHQWWDDLAYFKTVCERFGLQTVTKSASGARPAEKNLRELLKNGPVIAWVDAASLPHRAMPSEYAGGGYHVITIYRIDDEAKTALIGDRSEKPIAIGLKELTLARQRIKKFKTQLLGLAGDQPRLDLPELIRSGLAACHIGLVQQRMSNFTLEGLKAWGNRLYGSKDKDGWDRVFTPGCRLWSGLTSIYEYIDRYSAGGLCRPIFAEFLKEAADVLDDMDLRILATRYATLGQLWSDLANAALPEGVPAFKKARKLITQRKALLAKGAKAEEVGAVWEELGALRKEAKECFPLSAEQSAALRQDLQQRVFNLYEVEGAAHASMGDWVK